MWATLFGTALDDLVLSVAIIAMIAAITCIWCMRRSTGAAASNNIERCHTLDAIMCVDAPQVSSACPASGQQSMMIYTALPREQYQELSMGLL
jgi:hypothetical protein